MKYIGNVQAEANAEVFAVASGALPDGKPVIVNSNGTVSVVSQSSIAQALGNEATFETDFSLEESAATGSTGALLWFP